MRACDLQQQLEEEQKRGWGELLGRLGLRTLRLCPTAHPGFGQRT